MNFLDEFGLSASDAKVKISMSSIYDKSSQKITSTIIPQKADGSVDYINIRTYAFNASNNVRNEINGQRTIPDIKTIPANKETPEYYYPRTFPNGTFDVGKSQPVSASNPNAKYLGEVFIPTTATQLVPTYGTKKPEPDSNGNYVSTNTQNDSAYGLHYSPGKTQGCIAFGSQVEANGFADLSDKAIASGGKSKLSVGE